tara:strand:+ start:340 stop:975 length:636 start_codon:yes stop_codon:yes gene_type:complete
VPLPSSLTKYPHGRIRATLQLPRANIWDGLHIDKDSNDRKWKWKSQTLVNREYLYNYCKNNKKAVEIPIEHIAVDEWEMNNVIKTDGHNYINSDTTEPVIILDRSKEVSSAVDNKSMKACYLVYQWSDDRFKIKKTLDSGKRTILCYLLKFSEIDKTSHGIGDTLEIAMEQITESIKYHLDDENWTDGIKYGTNLWDSEDSWVGHEENSEV